MQSVKLSITCRQALKTKYDAKGLARIDAAINKWIAADAERGIRTLHIAIDDAKAMKRYKVPAVAGAITPEKVGKALDALVARLSPDYIVLLGSGDVVPFFEVANPTSTEDDEPTVPTDNPYACSQKFNAKKRASYLLPDRVIGRIPDLPGSNDPKWLIDYLTVASNWKSQPAKKYAKDLMVCCDTWKKSGQACMKFLSRDLETLMISPPSGDTTKDVQERRTGLLQMIKCHGGPVDSRFYGEKGDKFPEALRSRSLEKKTKRATVVGAMCCYGASLFDPLDAAAQYPGEPPIPSVYLRQGAFGFFGSTTTAWVGDQSMQCADWVVSQFLKSVLEGASLGRAALDAKQGFVRWNEQQGDELDSAEEKTLIQFLLLGDPSIHPVTSAKPAAVATASQLGAAPTTAAVQARRQRRATRHQLGAALRSGLPTRQAVNKALPKEVKGIAKQLADRAGDAFSFKLSAPHVQSVVRQIEQPELTVRAAGAHASRRVRASAGKMIGSKRYQYSWSAKRKRGPVVEIRLVSIQTDPEGNVVRTQLLTSS